jgi:hypothetical protein
LFRKQLPSTTPPKPKDRGRLDAKIDDFRKRLTLLRTDAPAPADAQTTFPSALAFGLVHARHVRIVFVALFALMVEMGATLGLFAAPAHTPAKSCCTYREIEPLGSAKVRVHHRSQLADRDLELSSEHSRRLLS